jgi:hypothetical protein
MKRLVPYLIVIVFGTGAAYRAFALDAVVEPHTEAAVLAADDDRLTAELRGDLSALDARLMPSYRDAHQKERFTPSKICSLVWRNTPARL